MTLRGVSFSYFIQRNALQVRPQCRKRSGFILSRGQVLSRCGCTNCAGPTGLLSSRLLPRWCCHSAVSVGRLHLFESVFWVFSGMFPEGKLLGHKAALIF